MTEPQSRPQGRVHSPEETYRLYIDESGDHVFNRLEESNHRYLCLLGCWLKGSELRGFHAELEAFKQEHLPHNPDDPVILHREDVINNRKIFKRLQDSALAQRFDDGLLDLVARAKFTVVAVVIDKFLLRSAYGDAAAHPYHLAIGFMLQRYCGFLNHVSRHGDVMAESRGGHEDRMLKDSYSRVFERGVWQFTAEAVQRALTSSQLKLKPKSANIAGLQLADILAHPVKQEILREVGHISEGPPPFAARLLEVVAAKFNRQLYENRVQGYGKVFFPQPK